MSAINNALLERARALIHPSATDAEVINAALKEFVDRAVKRLTRKARSHGMPTGTRYAGESFEAWDLKNRYREHMERQRVRLSAGDDRLLRLDRDQWPVQGRDLPESSRGFGDAR